MSTWLSNRAAIAGIGQTEFSKASGRTELQLACEAVKAALDDAGLSPADVDGLITFTLDSNGRRLTCFRTKGRPVGASTDRRSRRNTI